MPSDRDELVSILERRISSPTQRKRYQSTTGFFFHCQQGSTLAIDQSMSDVLDAATAAELVVWGDGIYCFGLGLRFLTPDGVTPWIKTFCSPHRDQLCLFFSKPPAEHLLPPRSLHLDVASVGADGFAIASRSAVLEYPFWAGLNRRVQRSRSMQFKPAAIAPQLAVLARTDDATLESAFGDRIRLELH